MLNSLHRFKFVAAQAPSNQHSEFKKRVFKQCSGFSRPVLCFITELRVES